LFITIAERINATRKNIRAAIESRDEAAIRAEAVNQAEAGATVIDVNGGTKPEEEKANLDWLLGIVAPAVRNPLCIDCADPELLEGAAERILEIRDAGVPSESLDPDGVPWLMINSISAEKERYDAVLPIALKYKASVLTLLMGDEGMPSDAADRIKTGRDLIPRLLNDGVKAGEIFIDPLIMPAGINTELGPQIFRTIRTLGDEFPGVRFTCGLTNVSHGLPVRPLLNRTFLTMLIASGLDSAILDPTDRRLTASLRAALALANMDPFCAGYINAFRNNLLDV